MDEGAEGRKSSVEGQLITAGTASPYTAQPSTLNPQPPLSPAQRAWRRFRANHPAGISAWLLAVIVVVVIGWPIILKVASFAGPGGVSLARNYQPEKLSDAQFE